MIKVVDDDQVEIEIADGVRVRQMRQMVTDVRAKGEPVNLSGFVKLYAKATPATPARKGINPFTKEPMTFKAKPASFTVRATALKALKDNVSAASKKGGKKK